MSKAFSLPENGVIVIQIQVVTQWRQLKEIRM